MPVADALTRKLTTEPSKIFAVRPGEGRVFYWEDCSVSVQKKNGPWELLTDEDGNPATTGQITVNFNEKIYLLSESGKFEEE